MDVTCSCTTAKYYFICYKGPTNGYASRFPRFSVYISNTTKKTDGKLCFQDNSFTKDTIPAVLTLNCTYYGRYVIYYNKKTSGSNPTGYSKFAYNELCEFEVYGKLHFISSLDRQEHSIACK